MQKEELVTAIAGPPALKVGRRLARYLAEPEPVDKACANPDCFPGIFTPTARRKDTCSDACRITVLQRKGAEAFANKRRGSNPNKHISKRVNGRMVLLHRYIVETERGHLSSDEIVHHRDERKHHNCYGSQLCATCAARFILFISLDTFPAVHWYLTINSFSNLEVLTDNAAAEHLARHRGARGWIRRRK